MEDLEYRTMFHVEDHYWWYVGLRDLVTATVAGLTRGRTSLTILDAGCGTGKLLESLGTYRAYGVELASQAFPYLRRRSLDNAVRATVLRIPFPDETFDMVVSMDVIYGIESPGDAEALREMGRVLKTGGHLLLNLPSYEFMRSPHDAAVHTRQRYTRGRLRALLAGAGFQIGRITYRNTLLFPVAALVRLARNLFGARSAATRSDLSPLPVALNRALTLPLLCENRLIRSGLDLPFGLSLFCVASKP